MTRDPAALLALAARVEAEGWSRELDARVAVAIGAIAVRRVGKSRAFFRSPIAPGDYAFAAHTDPVDDDFEFLSECSQVARYTSSLDAALALVREALPGWRGDLDVDALEPDVSLYGARLFPPGDAFSNIAGETPTPAIALVAATLRALAAQEAS